MTVGLQWVSAWRTVEGSCFVPKMFLGLVSLSCHGIYVPVMFL